jgi:hypothetical protein
MASQVLQGPVRPGPCGFQAYLGCTPYTGAYDRALIERLAELLDPVDVGVACSWIYHTVSAIQDPARPEGGRDDA